METHLRTHPTGASKFPLPEALTSIHQAKQHGASSFLPHIRTLILPATDHHFDLRAHHSLLLEVFRCLTSKELLLPSIDTLAAAIQRYRFIQEAHEDVLLLQEVVDSVVQVLERLAESEEVVRQILGLLKELIEVGAAGSQMCRYAARRLLRSSLPPAVSPRISTWVAGLVREKKVDLDKEVDIHVALQAQLVHAAAGNGSGSIAPATRSVLDWMALTSGEVKLFVPWMNTLLKVASQARKMPKAAAVFVKTVEGFVKSDPSLRKGIVSFLRRPHDEKKAPTSLHMFLVLQCTEEETKSEGGDLRLLLLERCEKDEEIQQIVSDLAMANQELLHELCNACLEALHKSEKAATCLQYIFLCSKRMQTTVVNLLLPMILEVKAEEEYPFTAVKAGLHILETVKPESSCFNSAIILYDDLPGMPKDICTRFTHILGRSLRKDSRLMTELTRKIVEWKSTKLVCFAYITLLHLAIATSSDELQVELINDMSKLMEEPPKTRERILSEVNSVLAANPEAKISVAGLHAALFALLHELSPAGIALQQLYQVHSRSKILQLIRCLLLLSSNQAQAKSLHTWMQQTRKSICLGAVQYLSVYNSPKDLFVQADFLVNLCDLCSISEGHEEMAVPRSLGAYIRSLGGGEAKVAPTIFPCFKAVSDSVEDTANGKSSLTATAFILQDFNRLQATTDVGLFEHLVNLVQAPPGLNEGDLALARHCKVHGFAAPDMKEMRTIFLEESLKCLGRLPRGEIPTASRCFWLERTLWISKAMAREVEKGTSLKLLQLFTTTILLFLSRSTEMKEPSEQAKLELKNQVESILCSYSISSPTAVRQLLSILLSTHVCDLREIARKATDLVQLCVSKNFDDLRPTEDQTIRIHSNCRDTAVKEALAGYVSVLAQVKDISTNTQPLLFVIEGLQMLLSKSELKWLSRAAKHKLLAVNKILVGYTDKQVALLCKAPIRKSVPRDPILACNRSTTDNLQCIVQIEWQEVDGIFQVDFKDLGDNRDRAKAEDGNAWSALLDVLKVTTRVKKWQKLAEKNNEEETKARLKQLTDRIERMESRLKACIQLLVQRQNNPSTTNASAAALPAVSFNLLLELGKSITVNTGCRTKRELEGAAQGEGEIEASLGWIYQAPRKKRAKTGLRSTNAFIDAALVEEDGTDDYKELEDFIVCTDGKVY